MSTRTVTQFVKMFSLSFSFMACSEPTAGFFGCEDETQLVSNVNAIMLAQGATATILVRVIPSHFLCEPVDRSFNFSVPIGSAFASVSIINDSTAAVTGVAPGEARLLAEWRQDRSR